MGSGSSRLAPRHWSASPARVACFGASSQRAAFEVQFFIRVSRPSGCVRREGTVAPHETWPDQRVRACLGFSVDTCLAHGPAERNATMPKYLVRELGEDVLSRAIH